MYLFLGPLYNITCEKLCFHFLTTLYISATNAGPSKKKKVASITY